MQIRLHTYLRTQGRNRRENLDATSAMVGRICPPREDRVKISEGATSVAPVAPVDTSLNFISDFLAVFALPHSKTNHITNLFDEKLS